MTGISAKTEMITGLTGGGMAIAPAIKNKIASVPFYEQEWWLAYIAIAGAALVTFSAINAIVRFRRELRERKGV